MILALSYLLVFAFLARGQTPVNNAIEPTASGQIGINTVFVGVPPADQLKGEIGKNTQWLTEVGETITWTATDSFVQTVTATVTSDKVVQTITDTRAFEGFKDDSGNTHLVIAPAVHEKLMAIAKDTPPCGGPTRRSSAKRRRAESSSSSCGWDYFRKQALQDPDVANHLPEISEELVKAEMQSNGGKGGDALRQDVGKKLADMDKNGETFELVGAGATVGGIAALSPAAVEDSAVTLSEILEGSPKIGIGGASAATGAYVGTIPAMAILLFAFRAYDEDKAIPQVIKVPNGPVKIVKNPINKDRLKWKGKDKDHEHCASLKKPADWPSCSDSECEGIIFPPDFWRCNREGRYKLCRCLAIEKQVGGELVPDLEAAGLLQTVIKGVPKALNEKIGPATCDTKNMVSVEQKYFANAASQFCAGRSLTNSSSAELAPEDVIFGDSAKVRAKFSWRKSSDCDISITCLDLFSPSAWGNDKCFNKDKSSAARSGKLKVSCGEASYTLSGQAPDKPEFERTEWPANKNPAFYKPLLIKNPPQGKPVCPGYVPGGPARLKEEDILRAVKATCKEWVNTNKGDPKLWTFKLSKTFQRVKDWNFQTYDPEPGGLGPKHALWKDDKIYLVKEWNSQYCEEGKTGLSDVKYEDISVDKCVKNFMTGIDDCYPFSKKDFNPPKDEFVKWTGWSYNYCSKWIVTTLPRECDSIEDSNCAQLTEDYNAKGD